MSSHSIEQLRGKRVTIVALGDSNTDFNHWSFGRNWLSMLGCNASNFFGRHVIVNSGVSGDNVAGALARLEEDVLAFHPDLAIVSLGLNDAWQCTPREVFQRDYRLILEKLLAIGACVLTRTSQPILDMRNGGEDVECAPGMEGYMADIVNISKECDVPCVDHYSLWRESMKSPYKGELVMLMGNRLHPNEYGHRRLYAELAPFLHLESDFQNEYTHLLHHQ